MFAQVLKIKYERSKQREQWGEKTEDMIKVKGTFMQTMSQNIKSELWGSYVA